MTSGLINTGSFWMNNTQVEIKASADQVASLLSKGFAMGRLQAKILTNEATPAIGGSQLLQG